MDKLPRVFVNKIDHEIKNDQETFKSFDHRSLNNENVNLKDIDRILNTNKYIAGANVLVETENDSINCKIISRTNNEIITIDNKRIPISKIKRIELI